MHQKKLPACTHSVRMPRHLPGGIIMGMPGGIPGRGGIPGGMAIPPPGKPGGNPPLPAPGMYPGTAPPTPRTGPARPMGAPTMGAPTGMAPRPAPRATPGPPRASPVLGARGKDSIWMDTTFSPRNNTSPSTRFSSLSSTASSKNDVASVNSRVGQQYHNARTVQQQYNNKRCHEPPPPAFRLRILRCSSQSPRTRFMCLSNAINVPTRMRLQRITRHGWWMRVRLNMRDIVTVF